MHILHGPCGAGQHSAACSERVASALRAYGFPSSFVDAASVCNAEVMY